MTKEGTIGTTLREVPKMSLNIPLRLYAVVCVRLYLGWLSSKNVYLSVRTGFVKLKKVTFWSKVKPK